MLTHLHTFFYYPHHNICLKNYQLPCTPLFLFVSLFTPTLFFVGILTFDGKIRRKDMGAWPYHSRFALWSSLLCIKTFLRCIFTTSWQNQWATLFWWWMPSCYHAILTRSWSNVDSTCCANYTPLTTFCYDLTYTFLPPQFSVGLAS